MAAFSSGWLTKILPGIQRLVGCEQGREEHSEGDVAVHTVMVFENLLQVCRQDLRRQADFVERLAALIHDWKKPIAQRIRADGTITFTGHEELAAAEVDAVAGRLHLANDQRAKLQYLVAEHGNAHSYPELPEEKKQQIRTSPYVESLCALQKADAMSCHRAEGGHLPVCWSDIHSETAPSTLSAVRGDTCTQGSTEAARHIEEDQVHERTRI